MVEVVVFHHAQGLTPGVTAFAQELRSAGHRVHVPDLYEGRTFTSIDDGVAHAEAVGFDVIIDRGAAAVEDLPPNLVYAGFSLGALPAQQLTQCRTGAIAALLFHGGVPASSFESAWPSGVGLQVHLMADDEWSEPDVAEELCQTVPGAELFVYPGSAHLFADSSLGDYDEAAAWLLTEHTLAFLDPLPIS